MAAWPALPASAVGVRLDQAEYERDFGASLWAAEGADCWKLERMQEYSEVGFPSWEAFMAGEWSLALRLYEEERPAIAAFLSGFEDFARGLYETGEDVESFFAREVAHLPPPRLDAGSGR